MKVYKQKLRDVWLQMPEFKPWLRRDPDDSYRAHCKFCKCGVNTKICDLRAHALTKKHIKRSLELGIEIKHNLVCKAFPSMVPKANSLFSLERSGRDNRRPFL